MSLKEKITKTLNELVEQYPDESYDYLSVNDKGFLIAHGKCLDFAKKAVDKFICSEIVDSRDITVVKWINEEKRALAHTFILIHGLMYDSNMREGYEATRDAMNTLFLKYAAGAKMIWGDCGIIVEEETNKVLYNPWPREGVVLMPYTEMRINGSKFLEK